MADENRRDIEQVLGFVKIFLLVFAGVSLFVGGFIIFNTFSMLVAQRTRELALLRAVGASQGQVIRMVVGEAVIVGLVGSALGLLLGLGLAVGLQAFFGTLGLEIAGEPADPPPHDHRERPGRHRRHRLSPRCSRRSGPRGSLRWPRCGTTSPCRCAGCGSAAWSAW